MQKVKPMVAFQFISYECNVNRQIFYLKCLQFSSSIIIRMLGGLDVRAFIFLVSEKGSN